MGANNLASGVHEIPHTACHSHLFGGCLFCLNHSIINLVVPLDLNQLIGSVRHPCKEIRVILTDSAGFRIVVVYGEIALVGGEHTREIHLCDLTARDVLHEAFLLWDGIEAVCVSMEALLKLLRCKARIAIGKHEVILCGEFVVTGILWFTQQY